MTPRLLNVVVPARDLARSTAFYRDALGLPVTAQGDGFCFLRAGGVLIAVHAAGEGEWSHPTGHGVYVDLAVDDIDGACERLRSHGVAAVKQWADHNGRFALVADPDGNPVELLQPAVAAPMHERYERFARLTPGRLLPMLHNAAPQIAWADAATLVYRRTEAGDEQVVAVDARTGARRNPTEDESAAAPPSMPARRAIREADPPRSGVLSPDGAWAIHQRGGNLLLEDVAAHTTTWLTTDGRPDDGYGVWYGNWKAGFVQRARAPGDAPPFGVTWTPDSRRVIVPRVDQSHVDTYPFVENAPLDGAFRPRLHAAPLPLVGEDPARICWHAFDVAGRSRVRLAFPDGLLFLHQDLTALRTTGFSSDSSHAYVVAHGDHMRSAHLFDVDLATGSVREVVSEHAHPRADLNTTSYQPPNVAVVGDLERVVWWSQRTGWGHLYLYDGRTGELRNAVTAGEWLVRDLLRVDDDPGGWVWFTASGREPGNPYLRRLYRARLDGSRIELLSPEDADCEADPSGPSMIGANSASRAIAPDGAHVAYTSSTVAEPPRTVLRRVSDAGLVAVLETCDPAAVEAEGYRAPREFTTTAADGTTPIHGLLYVPADFDPSRSYPVIATQYASPLTAATPRTYRGAVAGPAGMLSPGALVSLGLVAVTLDARGTTGRSREFANAGYGRLNVIGLDDWAAAIRQLADRHSWLDATRVGIIGGSYGGFTTIRAMLEFPDVFHVGVANAPLVVPQAAYPDYHWFAFHGVPSYDGGERRPHPSRHPDNYLDLDAVAQVGRLSGDLLVTVGELDENCPLGGVLPFVLAAYEADKRVELLYVPNATHYTLGRTRYVVRRQLDFLTRHLVGAEPPAGATLDAFEQMPEPATRAVPAVW